MSNNSYVISGQYNRNMNLFIYVFLYISQVLRHLHPVYIYICKCNLLDPEKKYAWYIYIYICLSVFHKTPVLLLPARRWKRWRPSLPRRWDYDLRHHHLGNSPVYIKGFQQTHASTDTNTDSAKRRSSTADAVSEAWWKLPICVLYIYIYIAYVVALLFLSMLSLCEESSCKKLDLGLVHKSWDICTQHIYIYTVICWMHYFM